MKIDLHVHSNCSDGQMTPQQIFEEAARRSIDLISITDHDSIDCQEEAKILADEYRILYLYGLELNVSFSHLDTDIAYIAGEKWALYRKTGGKRTRIITDFLIGAHAMIKAERFITRDRGFYKSYFPDLKILS